jgi:DUF3089 family protein/pectinacetylesterase
LRAAAMTAAREREMRAHSILVWVSALSLALAACGDDGHSRSSATATPTFTSVPDTPTATDTPAPPTATETARPTDTATSPPATSTSTPTATPTGTPSLLDELTASTVGKYVGAITPSSNEPSGAWTRYLYDPAAEQAICLRGGQYSVDVRHGTNGKVLLMLEGGGACWNNQTCWVTPLAKLDANPLYGAGMLDFDNPDNPFHDWNVVYAPYCDGSVFASENTVDYEGGHTYHHGLQNLSAAVTLMREQFPDPEQIVVSGFSAGGYGTFTGYGVTRVAYPQTPILVLNDSGPGLQNPEATEDIQDRNANWRINDHVPASCTRCSEQYSYLSEWALDRDPTLRVALFSNLRDGIIRSFNKLDADDYESLLREVTGDIESRNPDRFKRFFVQGESHTIIEIGQFYTTEIAATRLRDWTEDFLTDGPAWQDLIEGENPFAGFRSDRYADGALWMCRPDLDREADQCFSNDISATAVQTDGSLVVEPRAPADDPEAEDLDCFYIYPTVDLSLTPGNHTDLTDNDYVLDPLLSQLAPFSHSCRLFAPLYRQVTIGTYGSPDAQQFLDIAYADVVEAFKHYMGQYNHGRNFVIMGHSQGTFMTTQLLRDFVDPDPELRKRLVVALLIGGSVTVPEGQTVGGTFQNLPLCTTAQQTGCVIAYRSYADGHPPANGSNVQGPEGMDTACTNPAALGGGKAHLAGTYLPLFAHQPLFDVGQTAPPGVDTPFLGYHDFYAAECAKDDHDRSYLKVGADPQPGDTRENLIPFDHPLFSPGFLGTHVLDYNFTIENLITLVDTKAAALAAAQ